MTGLACCGLSGVVLTRTIGAVHQELRGIIGDRPQLLPIPFAFFAVRKIIVVCPLFA
jgi:hypothetical protein